MSARMLRYPGRYFCTEKRGEGRFWLEALEVKARVLRRETKGQQVHVPSETVLEFRLKLL